MTNGSWNKGEQRRRLRAGAARCREALRIPLGWRVEVGGRTIPVISQTLPKDGEVYADGDDLTNHYTIQQVPNYSPVVPGEVAHLYFSSTGDDGELEHICCVWLGTDSREPVLLDIDGRYVADPDDGQPADDTPEPDDDGDGDGVAPSPEPEVSVRIGRSQLPSEQLGHPIGYGRNRDRTWWCRESLRRMPVGSRYSTHASCSAEAKQYDTAAKRAAICSCPCHR